MPRTSRPDHAKARQRTDPLGHKNLWFRDRAGHGRGRVPDRPSVPHHL